ncbi:MAG: hypothetical protein AAF830_11270 [Pseudomonadota bacterium]
MPAPIVFFDIAGPNTPALRSFYEGVFDWPCGQPGTFAPGNLPKIDGSIREDPAEQLIYVGVPDISATEEKITELGGSIDVPRFEAPGVAVIGLFRDPAGNRMGLIEMNGGEPVVP